MNRPRVYKKHQLWYARTRLGAAWSDSVWLTWPQAFMYARYGQVLSQKEATEALLVRSTT